MHEQHEFLDDDAGFARTQLTQVLASFDDAQLMELCGRRSSCVLAELQYAASKIADEIAVRLKKAAAWSLVRVGDGEGNILSLAEAGPDTRVYMKYFNAILRMQHGIALDFEAAQYFRSSLTVALENADVLGFRSLDRGFVIPEAIAMEKILRAGDIRGVLGIIGARKFLAAKTERGDFRHTILTSAWIHLGLIPELTNILSISKAVVVISGIYELADEFRRRLGTRLQEFIVIPRTGDEAHYLKIFAEVVKYLENNCSEGTLILIGAGILGKIYCNAAKRGGCVAVDLGSAFDVLAGQHTRPVHRLLDFEKLRWL